MKSAEQFWIHWMAAENTLTYYMYTGFEWSQKHWVQPQWKVLEYMATVTCNDILYLLKDFLVEVVSFLVCVGRIFFGLLIFKIFLFNFFYCFHSVSSKISCRPCNFELNARTTVGFPYKYDSKSISYFVRVCKWQMKKIYEIGCCASPAMGGHTVQHSLGYADAMSARKIWKLDALCIRTLLCTSGFRITQVSHRRLPRWTTGSLLNTSFPIEHQLPRWSETMYIAAKLY